jgi:pimeloyl-ACP methyl ester carboxylesterase
MTMLSGQIAVPHGDGTLNLAYLEWGPADAEHTAICVHGISRNAHDFRWIGEDLAMHGWRVISLDIVGRGGSDWLDDSSGYGMPVYFQHVQHLMAELGVTSPADWIGTSMGGILGMVMAGMGVPFRNLVLNDVGPFIRKQVVAGIGDAVGAYPAFKDVDEVAAYLKGRFTPYGPVSDAQFAEMAANSWRKDDEGALRLNYDPRIVDPLRAAKPADLDLWKIYDAIKAPTLVLRGDVSEVLTAQTAQEMTERGPKAELVTFAGITHPLWLTDEEQINTVREFLER